MKMSLLQMSLSGSIIILVVVGIRALFLNKLPKKMFLVLWWIAMLRLLVPAGFPSSFSVYSLFPQTVSVVDEIGSRTEKGTGSGEADQDGLVGADLKQLNEGTAGAKHGQINGETGKAEYGQKISFWQILWLAGVLVFALFFLTAYIRSYLKFQASFPIEEESIIEWQKSHRIRRSLSVRCSEHVLAPLTYGIIRPVILLPRNIDWNNKRQLFL